MLCAVDHHPSLKNCLFHQVEFLLTGGQRHQAHLENLLEVANTSMDQLGRFRTRPRPEVILLDHKSSESPSGGIEEHACAIAAATDDDNVILGVILNFL